MRIAALGNRPSSANSRLFSMHDSLRVIRERFHPLFYFRMTRFGRGVVRALDAPVWLSMPSNQLQSAWPPGHPRPRIRRGGVAGAQLGSGYPGLLCQAQAAFVLGHRREYRILHVVGEVRGARRGSDTLRAIRAEP
jgi:hypothetical protein